MNNFAEILKDLRTEKNLTLTDVAKAIGVSPIAVSRWEQKTRIPNIEVLVSLSKFFDVSTDYLLGLDD